MTPRINVAGLLADAFISEGVDSIFALMGNGNMDFLAAAAPRLRIYNARHENMAVAMADGYARATGKVGVATVTCGPGLTQIATSLMVARDHRTPLVIFAGDLKASAKGVGGFQDIDQRSFVTASGALFHPVRATATAAEDVRRAFYLAKAERRPVVLNAPIDIQESEIEAPRGLRDVTYVRSSALLPDANIGIPNEEQLARAAKILGESARPIVLCGRGALGEGCVAALERLAESLGALLATTLLAKGAFDGAAYNIGLAGGYASEIGAELFGEADVVIAVGASLNAWTTRGGRLFPQAKLIVIDSDPFVLAASGRPADCVLVGDAKATVERLTVQVRIARPKASDFRTPDVRRRLSVDPREADIAATPSNDRAGRVDPRKLMLALDTVLPRDCIVVSGCGHFWSFPCMLLSGFRSREFIFAADFGAVGQGIGTALGVAAGRPEKTVIAFEGDASALMNIQELETAARHGIRILVFVLNDDALGSEVVQLRQKGLDADLARLPTPSFAAIARAFGLSGGTVASLDDLAREYDAFQQSSGTHVIDVKVDGEVLNPTYRGLHSAASPAVARRE